MMNHPCTILEGVTPFAGVWIEISIPSGIFINPSVTPFAGVWIEISTCVCFSSRSAVTPFAGVWIEIDVTDIPLPDSASHSLRGSVD